MQVLMKKIREALKSVLPVALIVFFVYLTPLVNSDDVWREMTVFLISSVFLVIGIGLFNLGADMAMTPMGEQIGAGLTKSRRLSLLIGVCFAMGVLVTVAEPDLSVLAGQVREAIDPTLLTLTVGAGVGLFLVLAVIKIVFRRSLSSMLFYFYMVLFALTALLAVCGKETFLALSFDSGGVTTGPITVPFIMALGVGIASTLGGRDKGENSFGLIALCSVGPMMAVILLGIFSSGSVSCHVDIRDYALASDLATALLHAFVETLGEVALALGLIAAFFFILQIVCLHLPPQKIRQILFGILYTYVGLVIFLTAVKVGYLPVGFKMGTLLAEKTPFWLVLFGGVLGMVTVLAEPAVHVLNRQVEEITHGAVSRLSMMIALSAGVGISIALSMIRIHFGFSVLWYLIPGYFLSLGLAFFVPGLYTAIAFDSGGVASGPLTSSFVLPFAIGACVTVQGEAGIMQSAFGIVAMVAMTPLITIQLLGFRSIMTRKVRERIAVRRILSADDEEIIYFS